MPGPVPLQSAVEELQSLPESLATTEERLLASVGLVVLAALLVLVVLPALVRGLSRGVNRYVLPAQARVIFAVVNEYIPATMSAILLRTSQLLLVFWVGVSLLAIWGLVELARSVLAFVVASTPVLGNLAVTVGILVVAYVTMHVLDQAIHEFGEEAERITDHQEEIMCRLSNVAVIAVTIVTFLGIWGINLSGVFVGAGFLGIIIGLAARQTLGAILAGFVLMSSRPFAIGDWVEIADHEGIITQITMMNTQLQNLEGETVVIPNDVVIDEPMRNLSCQDRIQLTVDVGVDYETDLDAAERAASEAIAALDVVAENPSPQVVATAFDDSAVLLELQFWIEEPVPQRRLEATRAVVHAVKSRFEDEGIEIPFPQRALSHRGESAGFKLQGSAAGSQSDGPPGTTGEADSS